MLQQHLPFTVLKLLKNALLKTPSTMSLQQHLPFTVLKHSMRRKQYACIDFNLVATAPTVYGIETA